MKILYSINCQSEIYEQACKLFENSIPSYKHLFQYTFSIKDKEKFKLLGLSEDSLLLKIKNELPSRRNKFIYNSALLQLQMLRYDFVITPNLTQYYIKQFLCDIQAQQSVNNISNVNQTEFMVNTNTNNIDNNINTNDTTGCLVNRQNIQNILTDANNITPLHVNASDYNINNKKTKCLKNVSTLNKENGKQSESEDDNTSTSESDDDDEDESVSAEDDDDCGGENYIEVKNTEIESKPDKINKPILMNKASLRNLKRKPSSLASTSNSESTTDKKSSINSDISSVEFKLPVENRRSDIPQKLKKPPNIDTISVATSTGITNKFSKLKTDSASTTGVTEILKKLHTSSSSSTGVTETFDDLCMEDIAPVKFDIYNEPASTSSKRSVTSHSIKSILTDYSNIEEKYPVYKPADDKIEEKNENLKKYIIRDNEGYIYYNVDFLSQLVLKNDMVNLEEMFRNFEDVHMYIKDYVRQKGYKRKDIVKINLALGDMRRHPTNRLKQAVFLYLLSDLITIKD
mgnify:CR=1 FL=1